MNKYSIILASALVLSACTKEPKKTTPMPSPSPTVQLPEVDGAGYDFTAADEAGWNLLFEDNFDEDLSEWNKWNGGAFNNELQIYKSGNLFVENNYLYIRQKRESASGPTNPYDPTVKSFAFTSGRIESKALYGPEQQGGTLRYAARIKLPNGEGLWPAFWSYNDPWPTQGEIDVLEFRGGNTGEYITNFFYGSEPNIVETNSALQTYEHQTGINLTDEFHVYELEWSQNDLVMKFDGNVVKTYNVNDFEFVDDLYDKTQKIVLNLAVGGDFFNGMGLVESDIPAESFLVVDWVKVFKQ